MNNKIINYLAVLIVTAFYPLAYAETTLTGVHAHYQVHAPDVLINTIPKHKEACQNIFKKKLKINGQAEQLSRSTRDEYYSADGQYMAVYRNGYSFESNGGPCVIDIIKFKDIQLYHISALDHYSFSSKKNVWFKKKMMRPADGVGVVSLLDEVVTSRHGNPKRLRKDIIARLGCDWYQLKETSWCEWRSPSKKSKGYIAPLRLNLKTKVGSGASELTTEAEFVNFKSRISADIFAAPSQFTEIGLPGVGEADNNPWCLAQKKKTGKNPCAGSEDE